MITSEILFFGVTQTSTYFVEKSCSILNIFIFFIFHQLVLMFLLVFANNEERIFEYILNRKPFGHETWPTNR